MYNRISNPNNVPSHIANQLLKFKSLVVKQLHYSEDEDFIEEDFTDENLLNGTPAPFMKVLHFALNDWSSHIANLVLKLGYSFEEKTDWNFMETVFSFIRNVMKTQPGLSLEQFFSQGFTLPKLKMVNTTVQFLIKKHIELRKKAIPPKRVSRRVLAQRSEQWVQQRQTYSPRSPIQERQMQEEPVDSSVQGLEIEKANTISQPVSSHRSVDPRMTTPNQSSAGPKLNPLPPALLRRVQDYRNMKSENNYSADQSSDQTQLKDRYHSPQCSTGAKQAHPKPRAVVSEDIPPWSEQLIHNQSSPEQDVPGSQWEAFQDEARESIRQLTKQIADLKSTQESNMLKCEKRVNELEKQNRELLSELALCSSRIEVIADRRPKFVKQHDWNRRPLARSLGTRQEKEASDESNPLHRSPRTMRADSTFKDKLSTASRPHAVAYARPVARASTSYFAEKPIPSTSEGIKRLDEVSRSDPIGLGVRVSGNYEKLISLLKER